jgi:site-specific DNA-cytosine methylase
MSHEVKVVELFAGVGGFALALNESDGNYKTVFTNQ